MPNREIKTEIRQARDGTERGGGGRGEEVEKREREKEREREEVRVAGSI